MNSLFAALQRVREIAELTGGDASPMPAVVRVFTGHGLTSMDAQNFVELIDESMSPEAALDFGSTPPPRPPPTHDGGGKTRG
jgi:hypothetical protein